MALIVCPDCSKEFSDLAQACPNCARPVNSLTNTKVATPKKHNYGVGFVAYLIVFVLGMYLLSYGIGGIRIWGSIFSLAGALGLISIGFRVIYRLLQKV